MCGHHLGHRALDSDAAKPWHSEDLVLGKKESAPRKKSCLGKPYNHMRGRSGECGTNATKAGKTAASAVLSYLIPAIPL